MTYRDNPFYALVPKYQKFGGKNLPIPIIYGNPQGRSKTFSNAQARSTVTSTKIKDFVLTRVKDYSVATIDGETLEASMGNENAFMDAATTEIDGAIHSLTRSLAINIFRDSSSYIGQVAATPPNSSGTFQITLKNIQDVTNFEVGQVLVVFSAKSGGVQRNSDGTAVTFPIVAVNRNTGVITVSGTYSGSGTFAANDFIFVEGDRGNGISGLEAWIPSSDPTSTPFFGVDRSVDVTRLGGLRLDATSLPIEEALIEADATVAREGFSLTHFFMNHKQYGNLKKALGSKVQYIDVQANARISFRGVMVDGTRGPIKVIPDQNCQADRIWGLNMDYVKLYSLGKPVRVIDADGLSMLRQAADDGVEVRYGFYGNLGFRAPGSAVNVQISA
jgi:hypothetical protein